ncbi:MAG: methyltransferase domain-containing protein [Micropepsaceae bacterium]
MTHDAFAYDAVAYPTAIVSHMVPDRIRAGGLLHGWSAPDPRTASVLEIGCGDGLNIIGMAQVAPGGRHVGFDLAEAPIQRGRALIEAAGLTNVTLEVGDILTWPRDGQTFDYIVCHGVYAWVPQSVQRALLELIGARLAPGGVAYVSYDALPAAATKVELQRRIVRDTAQIADLNARTQAAAELLATFGRHQVEGSRFRPQLDVLAKSLPSFDPAYFFHDWLAEHYAPPSLGGFAAAASAHGLKVAGDAGLTDLFTHDLDASGLALLGEPGDWAARGEALDFLRGAQMFRRTYLVRADAPPPPEHRLDSLCFSLDGGREDSVDAETGAARRRYTADGGAFLIPSSPGQERLMAALWDARPGEMTYAELAAEAGDETDAILRRVCTLGLVAAHAVPQPYVLHPGERPVAAPLIRAMFGAGAFAVTLRHARLVPNEPPTATFLTLCDGTRDRAALAAAMSDMAGVEIPPGRIGEALADIAGRRVFLA